MPYAVEITKGDMVWAGTGLQIGTARAKADPDQGPSWVVIAGIEPFLEEAERQDVYGEITEVSSQWPDGVWKMPVMELRGPLNRPPNQS